MVTGTVDPRRDFADRIADYVDTHTGYEALTKREVAAEAVKVMLDDIGAAQEFCRLIGLDVDLYDDGEPKPQPPHMAERLAAPRRRWWHRRPAARYMLTITDEWGRSGQWRIEDGVQMRVAMGERGGRPRRSPVHVDSAAQSMILDVIVDRVG